MFMAENEKKNGILKFMLVISLIIMFFLGLAFGYLSSRQECINQKAEDFLNENCEEGYVIQCVNSEYISNNDDRGYDLNFSIQ